VLSADQDDFSEPKHNAKFSKWAVVNLSGVPEVFKAYQSLWIWKRAEI